AGEDPTLGALARLALARACAIADPARAHGAVWQTEAVAGAVVDFERRLARAFLLRHAGDLDGAAAELRAAEASARGRRAARAARDHAVVHMLAGRGAEARACYEEAHRRFLDEGDARAAADVSAHLGVLALEDDDAVARARLEAALAAHREAGDRRREATVLCNLGVLEHQTGALDAAERRWSEALARNRAVGNVRFEAFALAGLAAVLHERGELGEARSLLDRSCDLFASLHDPRWEGWARSRRGAVRMAAGDADGAREDFEAARALLRRGGAIPWLPAVDVLEGRPVADDLRSSAVRIARRLVGAQPAAASSEPTVTPLALASDGAWFARGDARVSLARRHAMRRLLAALIDRWHEAPGEALSTERLVEAGWPGERMRADSGAARVYSAVRTLRRLGLEGVLISAHGGYLLSAAAPLSIETVR
ncbi:MAG: tetratricopeptide repeat protein, partial [Sandaracinaceae bacterium]